MLADQLKEKAIDSNIEVLRNRLNAIGVEEVSVGKEGDSGIVVELPSVQDPLQAKAMIGTPAVLEFVIVESMALNKAELLDKYDGEIPFNMSISKGDTNQRGKDIFYLLDGYWLSTQNPSFLFIGFLFSALIIEQSYTVALLSSGVLLLFLFLIFEKVKNKKIIYYSQ